MPRQQIDPAGIATGTVPRADALWQIGAHYLGHTNELCAIHCGVKTGADLGGYGGGASYDDGLWVSHGPRGVAIEQHYTREPRTPDESETAAFLASYESGDAPHVIYESRTLWRTTWPPIVAIVHPALTGAVWNELAAAARARRDATPSWSPRDTRTEEQRAADGQHWQQIEERCYAAAAAAWEACRPPATLF